MRGNVLASSIQRSIALTPHVWQFWAKEGLERALKRMALKMASVLDRPFTLGL